MKLERAINKQAYALHGSADTRNMAQSNPLADFANRIRYLFLALDRLEVERLIAAAYQRSSSYGLLVKTLFYTGARVNELANIKVEDLRLDLEPRAGPIGAVLLKTAANILGCRKRGQ